MTAYLAHILDRILGWRHPSLAAQNLLESTILAEGIWDRLILRGAVGPHSMRSFRVLRVYLSTCNVDAQRFRDSDISPPRVDGIEHVL